MAMISASQVLLTIFSGILLAVIAGIFASWVWAIRRVMAGRPLLPEHPLVVHGPVPWGVGTVILVILAYIGVNLAVVEGYSAVTGRARSSRPNPPPVVKAGNSGPDHPAEESKGQSDGHPADPIEVHAETRADHGDQHDQPPRPAAAKEIPKDAKARASLEPPIEPKATRESLSKPEQMFLLSAINSILLIVIPALVWLTSGARLRDLGLSREDWPRQVAVGVVAILLILPAVYGVQTLAVMIWPPHEHPLKQMIDEQFTPEIAYLAVLSAVVLAPLLEELIFRAILQGWLVRLMSDRSTRNASCDLRPEPPSADRPAGDAWPEYWQADDDGLDDGKGQVGRSTPDLDQQTLLPILMTSLIFAAVHAPQWPAPLAIFVLSMALGIVYHRTGSLLASIVMHATFNGLSTLALFAALLSGEAGLARKTPPEATISGASGVGIVKSGDVEVYRNHGL